MISPLKGPGPQSRPESEQEFAEATLSNTGDSATSESNIGQTRPGRLRWTHMQRVVSTRFNQGVSNKFNGRVGMLDSLMALDCNDDSDSDECDESEDDEPSSPGVVGARTINVKRVARWKEERRVRVMQVLNKKTMDRMEKTTPDTLTWLESWEGQIMQLALVGSFAMLDILRPLVYSWAIYGLSEAEIPNTASLNLAKQASSMTLGISIALACDGSSGLRKCMPTCKTLRLAPISSFFSLANVLSILALNEMDSGTFKLVLQLGLISTAVLSWLLLGRKYSKPQVQALVLSFISIIVFSCARRQQEYASMLEEMVSNQMTKEPPKISNTSMGLVYSALCFLCTSVGSVCGELFLTRDQQPYYVQKLQMDWGGLPCSILMFYVLPIFAHGADGGDIKKRGLLGGFGSWRVILVLVEWTMAGWLTGLIVKRLSALVKRLMQCGTSAVTYVICVAAGMIPMSLLLSLSAVSVVANIGGFFMAPDPPKPAQPAADSRSGKKDPPWPPTPLMLAGAVQPASDSQSGDPPSSSTAQLEMGALKKVTFKQPC